MAALIIFIGAFMAFCVSVLAGGGAGLVLIPLLGLALPAASVPGALSIGTAVSSASRLAAFRAAVRWDITRWIVPTAVPSAVLGAWLLTRLPSVYLELLLGCFLLVNVAVALCQARGARDQLLPEVPALGRPRMLLVGVGALAGFVSGFTGAVGTLFNDLYIRLGLTKDEIVATRAANEITLHLVKIGAYTLLGVMTKEAVSIGALVAVAALLATVAARRILGSLDDLLFRRLNYVAMAIAGLVMVTAASGEIASRHGLSFGSRFGNDGLELSIRWPGATLSTEWSFGEGPEVEWRRLPVGGAAAMKAASLD